MISDYWQVILSLTGIYIIASLGLYISIRAGVFSIAHAGFMAIGAFSAGISSTRYGISFPISLLVGAVFTAIIAFLIGRLILRLRGHFFLVGTFAFNELLLVIFYNVDFFGGPLGISGIPIQVSGLDILITLGLVLSLILIFEGSRHAVAFAATRGQENAAWALGISPSSTRLKAFVTGGVVTSLAGGLYAHFIGIAVPGQYTFGLSVNLLLFNLLGGTTYVVGPLLGASLLTIVPEIFRFATQYRTLFFGVCLVLVMVFRPQGLIDRPVVNSIRDFAGHLIGYFNKKQSKAKAPTGTNVQDQKTWTE